jgi:DNA-binding response OmpR family regulator
MQKPNILIVDDEDNIRESIKDYLSKRIECQLFLAANGEETLSLLKENCFDLILLDIRMPGLSGLDLIKQLRQHNPQVHILVISAWDNEDIVQQAIKEGADDFLHKSFSLKALGIKVKTALSKIDKYLPITSQI